MFGPETRIMTRDGPVPVVSLKTGIPLRVLGRMGFVTSERWELRYRKAPRSLMRVRTASGRSLVAAPEQTMFLRFLPGQRPWDLLLVREVGLGAALVRVRGGLRTVAPRRFVHVPANEDQDRTEEIHLVGCFAGEEAAALQQKVLSARFGIPESSGDSRDLSREAWKSLFHQVDTLGRAFELLEHLGLDPRDPHWTRRSLTPAGMKKHLLVEAVYRSGLWGLTITRPEATARRGARVRATTQELQVPDLSSYEGLEHVDVDRRLDLGLGSVHAQYRMAAVAAGTGVPQWVGEALGEDRIDLVERVPGDGLLYEIHCQDAIGLLAEGLLIGHSGAGKE